jgi:hypothetical protein
MDVVFGGSSLSGNDRPSKSYRAGRICREPECGTILSIYNDSSYCSRHQPMWVPRIRGKKSA